MSKEKIEFSEYTQTFRLMPNNYWLASVKDEKLVFDSWDGKTKELYKERRFLKFKVWLAYLCLILKS